MVRINIGLNFKLFAKSTDCALLHKNLHCALWKMGLHGRVQKPWVLLQVCFSESHHWFSCFGPRTRFQAPGRLLFDFALSFLSLSSEHHLSILQEVSKPDFLPASSGSLLALLLADLIYWYSSHKTGRKSVVSGCMLPPHLNFKFPENNNNKISPTFFFFLQ